MRRIAFVIIAVLLLSSEDMFAQCKKCAASYGCLVCTDTSYNAAVLCTLVANGSLCVEQGQCEGLLGECGRCRVLDASLPARDIRILDDALGSLPEPRLAEIGPFPTFLQTGREWRLVSVKMTHAKVRS